MRKKCILSILLASLIMIQSVSLPVWAETPDEESSETVSQQDEEVSPDQESTSTDETEQTEEVTTAPTVPVTAPSVPDGFSGDASVNLGSHSINAMYPVTGVNKERIPVKAAIAYELGTDTLVYADNVDEALYPASMTKIMTCLVALEMCDLNEIITVDGEVISYLDSSGSGAELKDGEQMSMENLLYCLMVMSANDAAVVIADHLAGSEAAFVELMNQKAAELGCTNTHFANAHGLHDDNHYTSARDMAKIMEACIQNEMFCKLYATTYYLVPETNLSEERPLFTTNFLISDALDYNHYDPRVIGGKTGFTTPAGRCLVTVSQSNGMNLVIVIMGAEAEFAEDGYSALSYSHFDTTIELMDIVYNGYMPAQVLAANQILEQFPVNEGQTDTQGYVQKAVSTVIPAGSDVNSLRYEFELDNGGISAPVKAGDAIGMVRVWAGNGCVAQQELYSSVDVEKKVVPQESDTLINPAALLNEEGSVWNKILMVVLGILGVLVLIIAIISIRNSIIRSRRKKRRAMRRRRRQ